MLTNLTWNYRKVINKLIGRQRKGSSKNVTKRKSKSLKKLLYLKTENTYLKVLGELAIKDQKAALLISTGCFIKSC